MVMAGDDIARLKAENAELRRLLDLYRAIAVEAGIVVPEDTPEMARFWQVVENYVTETSNGNARTRHRDPPRK